MYLNELFGSNAGEKTLLYLEAYGTGYAKKIAETFGIALSEVQKQLQKFERGGILVSRLSGKTRVFEWNPRFMFLKELRALLRKAIEYLPNDYQEKYFVSRQRPRRTGKPLP